MSTTNGTHSARDQFLAKAKASFRTVDMEAFGLSIRIRELSAGEVKEVAKQGDASIHGNVPLLIASIIDPETGERLFRDCPEDRELLNGLPLSEVNRVADAIMELNNIKGEKDEDAVKN